MAPGESCFLMTTPLCGATSLLLPKRTLLPWRRGHSPPALSLDWPRDLLWPMECSRDDAVWLPKPGLKEPCSFYFCILDHFHHRIKKPNTDFWWKRSKMTHLTASINCQALSEAILNPPPSRAPDESSHTSDSRPDKRKSHPAEPSAHSRTVSRSSPGTELHSDGWQGRDWDPGRPGLQNRHLHHDATAKAISNNGDQKTMQP